MGNVEVVMGDKTECERAVREALLRRLFDEGLRQAMNPKRPEEYDRIRDGFALLLQPAGPQTRVHTPVVDRLLDVTTWYAKLGLTAFPLFSIADISNHEINDRRDIGQAFFADPGEALLPYDVLMTAVGQPNDWTVTEYKKWKAGEPSVIAFEDASSPTLFWAEVSNGCPRLGTSWNTLVTSMNLLTLRQYVIVWHCHKALTNIMLDRQTWCWLRTRHNKTGALRAFECNGGVSVSGRDAEYLAMSWSASGGRCAEEVKTAA